MLAAVKGYDLRNAEIEVPNDSYYELDSHGNVVDSIISADDEIIEHAHACVSTIESIGPGPETMWEVTNNKLLRTWVCGCHR